MDDIDKMRGIGRDNDIPGALALIRAGGTQKTNSYGDTFLHALAETASAELLDRVCLDCPKILELLETENKQGATPLMAAAGSENAGAVRFLAERGADLEHVGKKGKNALSQVLHGMHPGSHGCLEELLWAGANPDCVVEGRPFIHAAIEYLRAFADAGPARSILRCLLSHGARTDLPGPAGLTAKDIASGPASSLIGYELTLDLQGQGPIAAERLRREQEIRELVGFVPGSALIKACACAGRQTIPEDDARALWKEICASQPRSWDDPGASLRALDGAWRLIAKMHMAFSGNEPPQKRQPSLRGGA